MVQGDRTHEGNFMKQKTFFILLTFFTLILTGCQEKPARRSSNTNPYNANCTGQAYWTTPGCAGYCQYNPSANGCGGTTGGTIGGTTGTTTGGATIGGGTTTGTTTGTVNSCLTNPYSYACYCQTNPHATGCAGTGVSVAPSPGWGNKYYTNPPDNTSSTCGTYNPSGVSQAYETRKGTITVGGGQWYNPSSPTNLTTTYNSSTLRSVSAAKTFFITDSMIKVRFKVRAEPETQSTGSTICQGRTEGQSWLPGYFKLKFAVSLVGTKSDNTTAEEPLGTITGAVNSCTSGIDLSPYAGMYPNGMYLKISNVTENKGCSNYNWQTGFSTCSSFVNVRSSECWTMDIEVAADGTKTFD